jgi:hypothetical protein
MGHTLAVLDPLADLQRIEGVPSAIRAALDAVDAVLRDHLRRRLADGEPGAALRRSAEASATLTGEPDRWRDGALRLYTEVPSLSALIRVAPGQAIARAHSLVAYGQWPADLLGRVRDDPAVGSRMMELNRLLTMHTEASALILAAIAHAELATAAPFGMADGLVARAVERMVLICAGVDPYGLIGVELGHAADPRAYASALEGYAEGSVVGVREWLRHCAAAVSQAAEAAAQVARD